MLPTSISQRRFGFALGFTIVLAGVACSDKEPTSPEARSMPSSTQTALAAAGATGMKRYGIQAHGTIMTVAPYIAPGARNILDRTNPQLGVFCVQLADGVDVTTAIAAVIGSGFTQRASLAVCNSNPGNWISIRVKNVNNEDANMPFDLVIP